MIKDANSHSENFKGSLADIYRAILERIAAIDLDVLEPALLAQISTIAIKDSLGGQVHYIRKDRSETRANRSLSNRDSKAAGKMATSDALPSSFNATLRYIFSVILEKSVSSDLTGISPERFAHISTVAIRESMGGQVFYIPMGLKSELQERATKISALWDSGCSTITELALQFQVSQQHVYEVLNRYSEKYRSTHSGNRQARKERNEKLLAGREAGATYRQLGQDFGLCSHQVRCIVKSFQSNITGKNDDRQENIS